MKNYTSFLFFLILGLFYTNAQDNRSFEQINDSILREATLIYQYDKAFVNTAKTIDEDRGLRKTAGEILVMPKTEKLHALIFSKEKETQIVGEMIFDMVADTTFLMNFKRGATVEELNLLKTKHKVMTDVQNDFSFDLEEETYINPIFIPFKEKIGSKEVQLYKLYLLTETTAANTVPFGNDFLFFAKENGNVFYNLQFNLYMPVVISNEFSERQTMTIEYPKREHYITPTDIFLFMKFGVPKDILNLRVKSNYLGVFFDYNWDRETLDVVMY